MAKFSKHLGLGWANDAVTTREDERVAISTTEIKLQ